MLITYYSGTILDDTAVKNTQQCLCICIQSWVFCHFVIALRILNADNLQVPPFIVHSESVTLYISNRNTVCGKKQILYFFLEYIITGKIKNENNWPKKTKVLWGSSDYFIFWIASNSMNLSSFRNMVLFLSAVKNTQQCLCICIQSW